jgi:H+/Cl- antiporter ClcA
MYLRSKDMSSSSSSSVEETLAYAGAAGTLTGFMNVPLAGPIFAMEMTSRRAGISPFAARSWSAAVAASLAGMAFVRGVLTPDLNVGGHFLYGAKAAVGAVTGRETILASLACGVGGAIVGTFFHKTLKFFKAVIWPPKSAAPSNNREKFETIGKKTLVALAVGMLSMFYPQTMFWGEGSLQCMIDGQCTPFSATPHGIPLMMTKLASVNPNQPFSSGLTALQVGMAKFMAIALASAGKFPGGVIFPLLSNGAMLSHAFISALRPLIPSTTSSLVVPLMTMSFMAATLTSITRTPLATVLILALTASGMTPLSALLPGVLMASYVSVWVSERLSSASFFNYSK